jgi:hypothetical protein
MRALFCVLVILLTALSASAQTADQRLRARKAYQLGQQRFDRGDYAGAQRSFEEAYHTLPNPVVLLSIAECQLRQNQWTQAEATFARYLVEAPHDAPRRGDVEGQLRKLRAMPGTLDLRSSPSGASINVDGKDMAQTTPARLSLAPGDHVIELYGPDGERGTAVVNVSFASEQSLHVVLEAQAPPAPEPPEVAQSPEPAEGPNHEREARLGRAAWAFTGVALAAGLGVAVLGPIALKRHSLYKQEPTVERREQGLRLTHSVDALIGVAAASAVTAGVLFAVRAVKRDRTQRVAVRWTPLLSPQVMGIDTEVRF